MAEQIPLGKKTEFTDKYDPGLLFSIPRAEGRQDLGLESGPPFSGVDIWNAYELSWLTPSGKPAVATAEIRIPSDSPNLVESKSLKLYLNSLNGTEFSSSEKVGEVIQNDISQLVEATVEIDIQAPGNVSGKSVEPIPGICIDQNDVKISSRKEVSPEILKTSSENKPVEESLYTHLFRSLCPITSQPDWATVSINYTGVPIEHSALLQYLISYRNHNEFHEHCVERIFMDILNQCQPEQLTVYARYTRRGGIDINPYRTNGDAKPENTPAWRQ